MSSEVTQEYLNEEEWWIEEGYASPEDVPTPAWHLAVLKERMERYRNEDISTWRTWEEIREESMREIMEEMKRRQR